MRRISSVRFKFNLLLLALAVAILTPVRLIQAPGAFALDDPCLVVRDCCAKMAACCCEVTPPKPAPPADLAAGELLSPTPKFVAIKEGSKFISHRGFVQRDLALPVSYCLRRLSVVVAASVPLYILNRALLI